MLTTAFPPLSCASCVSAIIDDRNTHSQVSLSFLPKKLVFLLVRVGPICAVGLGYACLPKNSLTPLASFPEACALASASASGSRSRSSRASASGEMARMAAAVTATENLRASDRVCMKLLGDLMQDRGGYGRDGRTDCPAQN